MMSILFCEEDTPGSFLTGKNPADLKNEELRFWLKRRKTI